MRVAVLFSGGKDSNFALFESGKFHDVVCLITMKSQNSHSYMFQSAGVDFTSVQAEALGLPQIIHETRGEKEAELDDLRDAILEAKEAYGIEGVVTGAINSAYQASRVQRICMDLDLWCFNPLWQKDQLDFLHELLDAGFKVMIVGVASYPFDSSFLGEVLDESLIEELRVMGEQYKINPAGEGGEIETFVLDGPTFLKRIEILKSRVEMDSENSGELVIEDAMLVGK